MGEHSELLDLLSRLSIAVHGEERTARNERIERLCTDFLTTLVKRERAMELDDLKRRLYHCLTLEEFAAPFQSEMQSLATALLSELDVIAVVKPE
jgi:hypothetical protein